MPNVRIETTYARDIARLSTLAQSIFIKVNPDDPEKAQIHEEVLEAIEIYSRLIRAYQHCIEIKTPLPPAHDYVLDGTRTKNMVLAAILGIKDALKSGKNRIKIAELGSGMGFVAGLLTLMDRRIQVYAYESNPDAVTWASTWFCDAIPGSNPPMPRAFFEEHGILDKWPKIKKKQRPQSLFLEQRDLLTQPVERPFDLYLHEHLSAGLTVEPATEVIRATRIKKAEQAVPYSVVPLLITAKRDSFPTPIGHFKLYSFESFHEGRRIILADRNSPSHVHIEAELQVSPSEALYLGTGTNVCWYRSSETGYELWTSSRDNRNEKEGQRDQYILGPLPMRHSMFTNTERGPNPDFAVLNEKDTEARCRVLVDYPIGAYSNRGAPPPSCPVRIENLHGEARLVFAE